MHPTKNICRGRFYTLPRYNGVFGRVKNPPLRMDLMDGCKNCFYKTKCSGGIYSRQKKQNVGVGFIPPEKEQNVAAGFIPPANTKQNVKEGFTPSQKLQKGDTP